MGYKNPDKQREFQAKWYYRRRIQWIAEHGPCAECGSWERLEILQNAGSVRLSHRVWSLTEAKREPLLANVRVLCRMCALVEKGRRNRWWWARLSKEAIIEIRTRRLSQRRYAAKYGLTKSSVEKIQAWID